MSTKQDNKSFTEAEIAEKQAAMFDTRPDLRDAEHAAGSAQAQAAADQAEAYGNNSTRKSEEEAGVSQPGFTYSQDKDQKQKSNWKVTAKKKGPLGALIALLVGGGGGLAFIFSPGLVVFHFTETLLDDLNDQVAAADIRTDHVFRSKLDKMSAAVGVCSNSINIRCKFGSMSARQIRNFERAGFVMDCNGPCTNRVINRLSSITTPSGDLISNPRELMGRSMTDPNIRRDINRAYNPTYRMMSDKVANNRFVKFGGKVNQFIGTKRADMHTKLLSASETSAKQLGKLTLVENSEDDEGRRQYTPEGGGDPISMTPDEAQRHNSTVDRLNRSGGVGKAASNTLKGVGIIGAADLACTAYNMYRLVTAGAKVIRAEQLAKLATAHHALAQAAKASDGSVTPEQMDFLGEMLTETDTRKQIIDPSKTDDSNIVMMDNPNYGKSAMDSVFYKTAAYGDTPRVPAESVQYMVGGGAVGDFEGFAGSLLGNKPPGCEIIQHPVTRIGSAITGIVLGGISGGGTLTASLAFSATAGFLVSYLEGMFTDMLAGDVISEDTTSTQYGDAVFSGTAVVQGSIAKGRGLRPLTEDNIAQYMDVSREVAEKNQEVEVLAAKDTPLDPYNQYSFLGSIVRSNLSSIAGIQNGTRGVSGSLVQVLKTSSSILTFSNTTHALDNAERFTKCDDRDYAELRIAADIACNVRYGLTDKELAMNTDDVLNYMINNGHINEESGEATSDEYTDYLEKCVTDPYGIFSTGGEEDQSGGTEDWEKCTTDGDGDIYNYFRVYTLDKSIVDSMEDDPIQTDGDNSNSAPSIPDGDWMWPIKPEESKAGPCFGGPRAHAGMDINSNSNSDVYAMQTGQVIQIGSGGASGNYIIIKGESGVWYGYQHLVSKPTVSGTVQKGQIIGRAGTTGNVKLGSSSAHLHITMSNIRSTMGSYGNISEVFDPMTVLNGVKPSNYSCTNS